MTSDLVIITPELSPGSGGVADHTLMLLRYWRPLQKVTLLVPNPDSPADEASGMVKKLGSSAAEILEQLRSADGHVFVQYSAYGFSRFGFPRALIRGLIDWKKQARGRLVLMFHEIWGFWPMANKNFVVQQLHRRALGRLLEVSDAVFTTTSDQASHLRRLRDATAVQIIPAASNIGRHESGAVSREAGGAVLFGLQLSRVHALQSMNQSLTALAEAGRIVRIVCVGQGSDPRIRDKERELLEALNLSDGFDQLGPLSERSVSDTMSRVRFGIFGQPEKSCCKSGSFMAYAVHQLNVISEFANPSKPPPVSWLVSPAELLGDISAAELNRRAECLRIWQEENCSWEAIAGKLGQALGMNRTRPPDVIAR